MILTALNHTRGLAIAGLYTAAKMFAASRDVPANYFTFIASAHPERWTKGRVIRDGAGLPIAIVQPDHATYALVRAVEHLPGEEVWFLLDLGGTVETWSEPVSRLRELAALVDAVVETTSPGGRA